MMLSKDDKVCEATRWFVEEERKHRDIGEDSDSRFLNWSDERGGNGTACLAARTRKACVKLKIQLKLVDEEMIVKTEESEYKTRTAMGIGRFLTRKVIPPDKFRKLIGHQGHGATYTTLKGNEVSNYNLTDVCTHKSDACFRFLVVGRADCLPTPVNLPRSFSSGPVHSEQSMRINIASRSNTIVKSEDRTL
jgi:hypothetical protein